MGQTLEQLATDFHAILSTDSGPAGRARVRDRLVEILTDADFVAANLADGTPERKLLHEDRELGFCILAHAYEGARESAPHDHGPSWAIYGQAAGETEMTEWAVVEPAAVGKAGKVRKIETYTLAPGDAHLYNEGELHSPRRNGATRLIRIEGANMDGVQRLAYEPV